MSRAEPETSDELFDKLSLGVIIKKRKRETTKERLDSVKTKHRALTSLGRAGERARWCWQRRARCAAAAAELSAHRHAPDAFTPMYTGP